MKKSILRFKHNKKRINFIFYTAVIASLITQTFTIASSQSTEANTTPQPLLCESVGYLTQANTVSEVNIITGDINRIQNLPVNINAAGYNALDNLIYAWDYDNLGIGRFGLNNEYEFLGLPVGLDIKNWNMGDVDPEGFMWIMATGGNAPSWAKIDLRSNSTTFLQILESGNAQKPLGSGSLSADWVYSVRNSGFLYMISQLASDGTQLVLERFDMQTHTREKVHNLGSINGIRASFGAMYSGLDGFIYASDNDTGIIVRIDPETGVMNKFADGPRSSVNDGARCENAVVAVDYADAPLSYGSNLADDGPRHALPNFTNNQSNLMLGTNVTRETDAKTINLDEDDALTRMPNLIAGKESSIEIITTNNSPQNAFLKAWIDINQNGVYDANEEIPSISIPANSGSMAVEMNLPTIQSEGETWLRLRLSTETNIGPLGSALDGEVEDWRFEVGKGPEIVIFKPNIEIIHKSSVVNFRTNETIIFTVTAKNTGNVALTNLQMHNSLCQLNPSSNTLEVNQEITATCAYTVTKENTDLRQILNTAKISATVQGEKIEKESKIMLFYIPNLEINREKPNIINDKPLEKTFIHATTTHLNSKLAETGVSNNANRWNTPWLWAGVLVCLGILSLRKHSSLLRKRSQ